MKLRFVFSMLATFWASIYSLSAFAEPNIWETIQKSIEKSSFKPTRQDVIQMLPLLTTEANISIGPQGEILIDNGYIVIDSSSIRSFKTQEDFAKGHPPEFSVLLGTAEDDAKSEDKKDASLAGLRILIDIIPTHELFETKFTKQFGTIGPTMYRNLVRAVQHNLKKALEAKLSTVEILRPDRELKADVIDAINENPPDLYVSTQFNADDQDKMTVFCPGAVLGPIVDANGIIREEGELKTERQRARFVEAMFGRCLRSLLLGACIMSDCSEKMRVEQLEWQKAGFASKDRRNTVQVPAKEFIAKIVGIAATKAALLEEDGFFHGVVTRNLAFQGIFVQAGVIPFPDMQWVMKNIEAAKELDLLKDAKSAEQVAFIREYAETLVEALARYVSLPSLSHAK